MPQNELRSNLKDKVGRNVKLTFSDGEVLVGKLLIVLEEEDGIIFDLIKSNRPRKYERSDLRPSLWARISDVLTCEPEEP